jgi:hypothetical protein
MPTLNDVATLTRVAQLFRRNPSTLCVGVERYRRSRSELFNESVGILPRTQEINLGPANDACEPNMGIRS